MSGSARASAWRVREAEAQDVAGVAAGVAQLLSELGGTPPAVKALRRAADTLIADPALGCLLVAETLEGIAGALAASWQHAIHVPGRYGLVQELWVERAWRGRGVGSALLGALVEHARDEGLVRVEVGLPTERFAGAAATRSFYAANGFALVGPRMRLEIAR